MAPTFGNAGRRHDLDALRAFAMLLGIALHASLSFVEFPWLIQDSRQHEGFGLFFFAVHGFRMPLFFLLSGFFTAMLWKKRGLAGLLVHRVKRVFLPLLLGLATIIPALNWVSGFVATSAVEETVQKMTAKVAEVPERKELNYSALAEGADAGTLNLLLEVAAKEGNVEALGELLEKGANLHFQGEAVASPLHWAAGLGRVEAVEFLIEKGADLDVMDGNKATPLHWAAFFGQPETVEFLVEMGANLDVKTKDGSTALDSVAGDWNKEIAGLTVFIASLLDIHLDLQEVEASRPVIRDLLREAGAGETPKKENGLGALLLFLMIYPVFHHLWFLWFLCWLVAFFAVFAWVRSWFPSRDTPRWILYERGRWRTRLWPRHIDRAPPFPAFARLLRDIFLFRSALFQYQRCPWTTG